MGKKKKSSQLKRRAWFALGFGFLIGFLILILRLFQLQVIEGPDLKAKALQQRTKSVTIEPKRGTIYDRNEKILAQSAVVWNVFISPKEITEGQLPDVARNLSAILDVPESDILELGQDKESWYKIVKRQIDNPKRLEVEAYIDKGFVTVKDGETVTEKITGVFFEKDTKRYYAYGNLASTVVGFTNQDKHGVYGIEAYYDDILSGTPGINVSARNPQDLDVPGQKSQVFDAQDGYSVVLTIDETVQGIVEKNLEMAVVEHNVKNRAVCIVMNIKTGEILAMSTKPDFDPNQPYEIYDPKAKAKLEELKENSEEYDKLLSDLRQDQWRNKAISDAYEPGSVYKIVTASISLEEKKSFLDDSFYCSGVIEVADRKINCHVLTGHGGQNFFDIMRNSCNPAFVTLGLRNGPETTYNYMTNFGLGKATGIDLPGEDYGILHTVESLGSAGQVPLASTSFGQSFTTTPIQLVTAVSAAVNGGYLVQPYVVRQIRDADGNVVETIQPQVKRQVISEETSEEIRQLVEVVVTNGSGKHAAIPGYRIGGKTGTSEILTRGNNEQKGYVLSFVGFAPMDDPVYVCLVALDDPDVDNPLGSVIAAPVVGAIMQEMLPYLGVEPFFTEEEMTQKPVEVPSLISAKPHDAQATLTSLGLKTKLMGQGDTVLLQIPRNPQTLRKGGTVILYTDKTVLNSHITVPNLEGKTAEQIQKELQQLELNVAFVGSKSPGAVAGDHWPSAGEKATTADVITVTMVEGEKAGTTDAEIIPKLSEGTENPGSTTEEILDNYVPEQTIIENPESVSQGNPVEQTIPQTPTVPEEESVPRVISGPSDLDSPTPEPEPEPTGPASTDSGEFLDAPIVE